MRVIILVGGMIVFALASTARADERLDALAAGAAAEARRSFEGLGEDQLAITVIDLRDADRPRTGNYRGDQPMFPASVVKLFYLVAAHQWLEDGKLEDSDELRRALRDMIVDSSNDATAMIVDALTGAINGPPLPDAEMKRWTEQRNAVNRYFASLGYPIGGATGINVNQKTYCEGPYGRERIFIGEKYENRNHLTTSATARLLCAIVQKKAVSPARSREMLALLRRDPASNAGGPDSQDTGFSAGGLPAGAKVWSKAGWTSTARHDAAYIETPDGLKAIVVVFTARQSRQRRLIPSVARSIVAGLQNAEPG